MGFDSFLIVAKISSRLGAVLYVLQASRVPPIERSYFQKLFRSDLLPREL